LIIYNMDNNKCVSWRVFTWAMGIILTVFSIIFITMGTLGSRVSVYSNEMTQIQVQLSQIQTDIEWIKLNLK
tara:strand:+ start:590 stop:805 length:216 start_codon:yes stop_codon:yes gene_type:complete